MSSVTIISKSVWPAVNWSVFLEHQEILLTVDVDFSASFKKRERTLGVPQQQETALFYLILFMYKQYM